MYCHTRAYDRLERMNTNEHIASLSREGRVLIPAALRHELGLKPGETLTLSVVDGELRVASRVSAIRRMQKRLAHLRDPRHPVVDELLHDRRDAARRE